MMPINSDDRYQVICPGASFPVKGFHIATCRLLEEARKAKASNSNPDVFIWDNKAERTVE